MSDSDHFTIVPAAPGYRILYEGEDGLFASEHVVAWRIETFEEEDGLHSTTTPVTVEGEPASNKCGLVMPDGSVSYRGSEFESLYEAYKHLTEQRRLVADSKK